MSSVQDVGDAYRVDGDPYGLELDAASKVPCYKSRIAVSRTRSRVPVLESTGALAACKSSEGHRGTLGAKRFASEGLKASHSEVSIGRRPHVAPLPLRIPTFWVRPR